MSLNNSKSFLAGYLPALANAYFTLTELFAHYSDTSHAALHTLVQGEIPRLRETSQAVVANIKRAQTLATEAGFDPPAPPRFPKDYDAWFEEIHAGFYENYTLHDAAEICFRTGHYVGNMLCAWDVLSVTLRLLSVAPETEALREQTSRLLAEIRDTLDDLRITAKNPNGPETLWGLAMAVTDAVDYVNITRKLVFGKDGKVSADQLVPMAELLQQQMGKIADKAGEMDEALTE